MGNAHTMDELRQFQAMPLTVKVAMTQTRIRGWVNEYGKDGVYVSFSGGKDSTVLLHIVRELYPDIEAVFVDTGLEYPEIRDFVKTFDNVTWLKPKMTFRQVIEKYGYPFISKEISERIGVSIKWCEKNNIPKPFSEHAATADKKIMPHRLASLLGIYEINWGEKKKNGGFKEEELSASFLQSKKWRFMLDSPYLVSSKCCDIMKKSPAKAYQKKTGKRPILATMADESRMRMQSWLKNGCNGFDMADPVSNPMAFWTEQDVLMYIKVNHIQIASVYGDIEYEDNGELKGQMDIADYGLAKDVRKLRTTGCDRTGCMFCGYGCHLEKKGNGRFEKMKETHPKQYDYIMRPKEKGGLNYKAVIDWINEHGNIRIPY